MSAEIITVVAVVVAMHAEAATSPRQRDKVFAASSSKGGGVNVTVESCDAPTK